MYENKWLPIHATQNFTISLLQNTATGKTIDIHFYWFIYWNQVNLDQIYNLPSLGKYFSFWAVEPNK